MKEKNRPPVKATPRPGEVFFNALLEVDPEFAESIRGTALDPFFLDGRIPAVLVAWAGWLRGTPEE